MTYKSYHCIEPISTCGISFTVHYHNPYFLHPDDLTCPSCQGPVKYGNEE